MTPALKVFLLSNLLLGFTYFSFRIILSVVFKPGGSHDYKSLTRLAQTLMLLAIAGPVVAAMIPPSKLPHLPIETVRPLRESLSKRYNRPQNFRPGPANAISPALLVNETSFIRHASRILIMFRTRAASVLALSLFLLGFIFHFICLVKNYFKVLQLVASGLTIRHLKRVHVVLCDDIVVPFSVLLGRKAFVVLSPETLEQAKDFRVALKHELQHHRHRDTAWAQFTEVLICVFFMNPFIYLWKRQITELQELSCDEALIRRHRVSSHDYGSCLIRVAEAAIRNHNLLVGTTSMAVVSKNPKYMQSFLKRRVEMFANHEQSKKRPRLAVTVGTIASLFTMALAFGAQQSLTLTKKRFPNPGVAEFDPAIQSIATQVLRKAVEKDRAEGGFLLIGEPTSGRVLAAANITSNTELQKQPHWALAVQVEPASAMKTIIAAAATEQGMTSVDELHNCENNHYTFGGRVYYDHMAFDHLTTAETIIRSSNICGIKIGEKLNSNGLAHALEDFGFGPRGSASDFPEAMSGHYPSPDQLPREEYIPLIATGYSGMPGFHVSPLEMLQAYGAIANGGKLMKPVSTAANAGQEVRQVLSEDNARQWRHILARAVIEGTGKNARSDLYTTAGKTSTAYSPNDPVNGMGGQIKMAGFTGFAPVEQPKLVIYAAIIQPTKTQVLGNRQAAPLFKEAVEKVLQYMNVAPDQTSH